MAYDFRTSLISHNKVKWARKRQEMGGSSLICPRLFLAVKMVKATPAIVYLPS